MNYYTLIYPILSILCFFTLFFYPQLAIIFSFLSTLVLLAYLENGERTNKTDIISVAILIVTALIDPFQSIYYVVVILIPTAILWAGRYYMPDNTYLTSFVAPMPIVLGVGIVIMFFPSVTDLLNKSIIEMIGVITAPLAQSPDRLSDLGILSVFFADKELAAKYILYLLPCLSFVSISVFIFIVDRIRPKFHKDGKLILRDYRLPDKFVWLLILGGFPVLAPIEAVRFFSINILVICGILYFFQGVQMVSVLLDRFKIGGIFRGFIYIFLYSEPPVIALLSLMGLFSIWFRPKWSIRQIESDGGRDNGNR